MRPAPGGGMSRRTTRVPVYRRLAVLLAARRPRSTPRARRPAVGRSLAVFDLVDALGARGRCRLEGAAGVLTPVMAADWTVAVEPDMVTPPGQDTHGGTVVGWRRGRSQVDQVCQTADLRVAWTLTDLAGRTVPGPDEVAEALGMRLQRVAA